MDDMYRWDTSELKRMQNYTWHCTTTCSALHIRFRVYPLLMKVIQLGGACFEVSRKEGNKINNLSKPLLNRIIINAKYLSSLNVSSCVFV
jgi:hypothetical protein